MKSTFLIASLLLGSVLCQTGIVITGTTGEGATASVTAGTTTAGDVTAATTGTTGGETTGTTTGIATGIITGVGTTGSAVGNTGTVDIPAGNYALFGPISGPATVNISISVTSGAPVDVGVVLVDQYLSWKNGSISEPNFEFLVENQTNIAFPLEVNGAAMYLIVGNNVSGFSASNQASSVNYGFLGAASTIGAVVVPYAVIPPTTTTGTTGTTTGGASSATVSIPSDQYYYWAIPGPITGATASFGVTSGAPIDVLFLVDDNFNLFQNRQSYASLFRNLSVTTASFQNINIASGSTLYIIIGNTLSDLSAVSTPSTVQYQFFGFPATANLAPIPTARNTTGAAATTGTTTATTATTTTGTTTTGTTTGGVSNTVVIPSSQLAQFTVAGPVTGGSAAFTVTNGVPVDILMLTNNNYNLFLNGQPYETAYQALGTTNNVASPINLSAGNTLYILVGNNLLTGVNAAQSNVQYTFTNLGNPQLATITRPGLGIITTSTPQSSSSSVVVTWLMAFLCMMVVMAF